MDASTSILSSPSPFPVSSIDVPSSPFARSSLSARKRKPVVTYQSPASGMLDLGLLMRNTTMQIEAVAVAAAASRALSSPTPAQATSPTPSSSSSETSPSATTSHSTSLDMVTRLKPSLYRTVPIPRPPPRLYQPFSRPIPLRTIFKTGASSSSVNSTNHTLPEEPGRRSSSRTRRPAPKVREAEVIAEGAKERASPAKRKRGGGHGGRRKKTTNQEEDDSPYPEVGKRTRKRKELEVDESMPSPNEAASPPVNGYSTRAKKSRRAESSASDNGSGPVMEEFYVPTKTT
ncbi:hypothetical protein M422DRAFT_32686 [Sphaerobolus stellatus SS14]|uniref:Uncharacterized protein n=1 Tax=Sphaerobolus stellatus (strain SS14) TaxID=990650 RepID=A0A0C9UX62_SPHS4|nr:hypothetical protein M422DRAFT_32686 [Sphaerobolus stellatus SS14]